MRPHHFIECNWAFQLTGSTRADAPVVGFTSASDPLSCPKQESHLQLAELTEVETGFVYTFMRERLVRIVWWKEEYGGKPPANRDVNEAAKNIVMMDLAILQAEAAAGMYKKPIDELARTIHYDPLPPEVRFAVIAAWKRGGLLPAGTIDTMVPAQTTKVFE
jgi:hypothetical protein